MMGLGPMLFGFPIAGFALLGVVFCVDSSPFLFPSLVPLLGVFPLFA
jgi:hypothetical protein